MEQIRETFHRFGRVSGAQLSLEKSTSISVGYTDDMPLIVPWLRCENTLWILGVTFANSIRLMNKLNWDALVSKFTQQVYLHSFRTLSLQQRVTLPEQSLRAHRYLILLLCNRLILTTQVDIVLVVLTVKISKSIAEKSYCDIKSKTIPAVDESKLKTNSDIGFR